MVYGIKLINIGMKLFVQVLSNGRYRSVFHRAVVNSSRARISIPTFYCPSIDAVIAPATPLTDADHPAVFRSFTYEEYYQEFGTDNRKEMLACNCSYHHGTMEHTPVSSVA